VPAYSLRASREAASGHAPRSGRGQDQLLVTGNTVLYLPGGANLSGNAPLVIATANFNGHYRFHYDENLARVGPARGSP
jgi:hypothetical protein